MGEKEKEPRIFESHLSILGAEKRQRPITHFASLFSVISTFFRCSSRQVRRKWPRVYQEGKKSVNKMGTGTKCGIKTRDTTGSAINETAMLQGISTRTKFFNRSPNCSKPYDHLLSLAYLCITCCRCFYSLVALVSESLFRQLSRRNLNKNSYLRF